MECWKVPWGLAFEGLAFAAAQLNSTATGLDFPIGSES